MSYAKPLLDVYERGHNADPNVDTGALASAIDALNDCAQACIADTDADLSEPNVAELITCIRLCMNCADVCTATVAVLSRPAHSDDDVVRPLLQACIAVCKTCGDECDRHAPMHEHCRVCAEACKRCEQACRDLVATMK
jgi:uncharacterized protein DUF326